MADDQGKLSDDDRKKVVQWITRFRPGVMNCPICGSPNWTVGGHLVQPVTLGSGNSLMLGGVSYPQAMLISDPCGHTLFLNAVVMGLVSPGAEKKS